MSYNLMLGIPDKDLERLHVLSEEIYTIMTRNKLDNFSIGSITIKDRFKEEDE